MNSHYPVASITCYNFLFIASNVCSFLAILIVYLGTYKTILVIRYILIQTRKYILNVSFLINAFHYRHGSLYVISYYISEYEVTKKEFQIGCS